MLPDAVQSHSENLPPPSYTCMPLGFVDRFPCRTGELPAPRLGTPVDQHHQRCEVELSED